MDSELLRSLAHYDPETGYFTWLKARTNRVKVGGKVGAISNGYLDTSIDGKRYKLHRLAYLYMTGKLPVNQIDHINGIKTDNRWVNLREVTNKENQKNTKRPKNNKTGLIGVSKIKGKDKWYSSIMVDGRTINLGIYSTIFDAACARISANSKYNFHENHGR